jgi:hypothetical protein
MTNAKELIRKAKSLSGSEERTNLETVWQDVNDIFDPKNANITVERSKGDKENITRLFESAPINFVHQLKSIIIGVFFNRSIKPISITAKSEEINEAPEVKDWIDEFTKMMLGVMFNPKTGFERSQSEAVADDIRIGTIATFIEEGKESPIKYHTLNIKNFLIAENDEGDVDYVVIKDKMTAKQMIQKWGEDNVHEKVKKSFDKDPFTEFAVQLHILPREERDKNKIDKLNKEIAGFWIDEKHQVMIEELGWDSMPVAIGRSEKATGEIYGTSRAMIALADGRQINQMSRQLNEATEKTLNPPLNVNATYSKRINLKPGALNSPDAKTLPVGRTPIEQILTIGNIPLTQDLIQRKEQNIREIFFLDKLKIFDDPRATATQILELRAETFRIMGDFIFGIVDYTEQILTRTFDILFNKIYMRNADGQFIIKDNTLFDKEIPSVLLENPELKINYQNPITQSQKLNESASIEKLLAGVMNLAQVNPEILDNIDFDKVVSKSADILGIDPDIIKNPVLVKREREQRQAQSQEQQQLEQEAQAVDTASKAKQSQLI